MENLFLKALLEVQTEQNVSEIRAETVETIGQLKEQLAEQGKKFDEQMRQKSQFHATNVQNIIRKYEVKRMKYILDLKRDFEIQIKAQTVELKRLTDKTKRLKKNCAEIKHLKVQPETKSAKVRSDRLETKFVGIVQDLRQKLNRKSSESGQVVNNSLDEQRIDYENNLKTSENDIQTIDKLRSELKRSEELFKNEQNRKSELEKRITELQNERMALMNEVKQLQMNFGRWGNGQSILSELNRLNVIEQSHKYLAEQHSILYSENINLENAHKQLEHVSETQQICQGYLTIFCHFFFNFISVIS